jgi:hypothetical protein
MCGDYHLINRKTIFDYYPMPSPKEFFDRLGRARIFSIFDLRSRYRQLPLRFEDRVKKSF